MAGADTQLPQTVDQLSDEQLKGAFTVSQRRTSERWNEYQTEAARFRALRDEMSRRKLTRG